MGMAVYSPYSRNLCGESNSRQCVCTCFHQEAVDGQANFRTRRELLSVEEEEEKDPSRSFQIQVEQPAARVPIQENETEVDERFGLVTDCLGLCGPNCKQGRDGKRYASILIHDVCQSFIRSREAMPNRNYCSDEGWSASFAAILSILWNGPCPRYDYSP